MWLSRYASRNQTISKTLNITKGKVFDVTGKPPYAKGGSYHGTHSSRAHHTTTHPTDRSPVFTGHDASRALAKTSTKAEDVLPEWQDLDDKEKQTLADWFTYFSKRYNIVGVVEGATNMD
jgi:membrane-associated progesterone receptor component